VSGYALADEVLAEVSEALSAMPSMTAFKLQKLMFYANAIHLVEEGEALADFKAWDNGPVCPEIYARYKGHMVVPSGGERQYELESSQSRAVAKAVAIYGNFSAATLVEMTHSESPWIETYAQGNRRWIDSDLIRAYYTTVFDEDEEWYRSVQSHKVDGMTSTDIANRYSDHLS